ncbi:MAG: MFS transporter [Acidimicrobiia bacterium]|nr:MFS transporter [Acidimicrobiia bacterium]
MPTAIKNDRRTILGWAMYDWANSAYATTSGAIVAAFFTGTIVPEEGFWGMSGETLWAAVVSIGAFILFLGMPVLGAVADYTSSKRRFLWFFAMLGAFFTITVPFAPDGAVPLFLFLFLVSQIGFVAANVFYDGFLPNITTDDTIDKVSSKGFAYGYIGGGLYVLLAFILIILSGDDSLTGLSETGAARIAISGAGIWWIGFTIYSLRRLPEVGEAEEIPENLAHLPRWRAYANIGFGRTINTAKKLLKFKHILMFVVAYMFYNDGTQTIINVSGAYAEDTLNLATTEIIIAFLIVQFVAFFGALYFGRLADKIGAKRAIIVSLFIWMAIAFAGYLLPAETPSLLYLLAIVIGFVLGGVQALSRSLYGSMIPEEASAEFYGFFSVFSKFSAIWGPLLFAIVSGTTGSGRPAILSIIAFFGIGIFLLTKVDVEEARASRDRWHFDGAETTID